MDMSVVEGELVVAPVKKCSPNELRAGVTKQKIHGEIDNGVSAGKEL